MNLSLCPYKNLFGEPGKGIHKYRILDIGVIDVSVTVFVAFLIAKYSKQDFKIVLFSFFLFGIIIHRLFCVRTTIDKLLFR